MSRLDPLPRADLPHLEETFALVEGAMGFLPNSLLIMARKPGLVEAFTGLAAHIQLNTSLPPDLARLIAFMVSHSAGCLYCQAHTHHGAAHVSGAGDKLARIWDYETDEAFSEADRAALRVAQAAGAVPNAVSDGDFEALKEHFSDEQIVDIVAVISLFGFLNRWNDTLATPLEAAPLGHAEASLGGKGWSAGKHAAA